MPDPRPSAEIQEQLADLRRVKAEADYSKPLDLAGILTLMSLTRAEEELLHELYIVHTSGGYLK